MGSSCQSFGVARQYLAQAIGLLGHYCCHCVLADRGLKFPADPIVYSDRRGRRSRHFDASLVHLAWAEATQCNLITTMAGYTEYAAKARYRLIPDVW